ncbi:mannose-1-phosphate guanyltransferase [Bdellovibrio sp. ZAP7]|uniref:sugar phosphate nucleotidyltransferase n=1 Tax=Bdellovibrio sp. ZAP7 TaxID=2231053 RepID=UPI00115A27BA|nr:sugar phosphate nucleotidyltransferase [Bdellovibrio sp. ZAP7]QDK47171.1 mannose-1-phosphate guanyltransferase [Bdellovibrio sp. ZAP7]
MNVMVLAAGEGTRLRPHTTQLPKPAIPFLTLPLAAHALGFLQGIQINKLVVNTYHLPEKIHTLFNKINHQANELVFSDEVGKILDSGGGLNKVRSHFRNGGDFILMNADTVILPKDSEILKKALANHRSTGAVTTVLVMSHPSVGTQFGGIWADGNNGIKGFGKTKVEGSETGWHYIGVQIFSEKIFNYLPNQEVSHIFNDAVMAAVNGGEKAQVYPIECTWFETGNPTDLIEATKYCINALLGPNGHEKQALEKTFAQYSPSKVITQRFNEANLQFSSEAIIDNESKFSGFVSAGPGTVIGKNCTLENVIIGDGVNVADGTTVNNTILL